MRSFITTTYYDQSIEAHGMRKQGILGRGAAMGNTLYAIDYDLLPPEARSTIALIVSGGPFHRPGKDGSYFDNTFGDLPTGRYREYTVPTPGIENAGRRRIVARCTTGQLFFTACHYERVHVKGGRKEDHVQPRLEATRSLDPEWRNGFYIITGMSLDLRNAVAQAVKVKSNIEPATG
jgi:guanyl-specific ribonuclease Sa